ncbi:MAG: VWA domain-containing protein [Labilithrix sp.]
MSRAGRAFSVIAGTILLTALALLYPAIARMDAWSSAIWSVPVLAWLPLGARLPVLGGIALVLAGTVVWRMTLASDARTPRMRIGAIAPLLTGPRGFRTKLRDVPGMLRGAAIVVAVLALGRPQNVLRGENADEKGIDMVVVLDLSNSMKALMDADQPAAQASPGQPVPRPQQRLTRLETAKEVILDFVARRKNDRIGVVVFGRTAYILSPPTLDKSLLSTLVSKMELGLIDGAGTAIGDAVGTAVARLRRSTARSKAVILLTDGDSNAGSIAPDYAAHLAQEQGVKVFTVQIGSGDDVDVQEGVDLFGQPKYVREHFPTNPELLKRMASSTGGDSFIATDKKGLESSMHAILDKLEKTLFEQQRSTMEDLFGFLLIPAVALIALEALVRLLVVRRFP